MAYPGGFVPHDGESDSSQVTKMTPVNGDVLPRALIIFLFFTLISRNNVLLAYQYDKEELLDIRGTTSDLFCKSLPLKLDEISRTILAEYDFKDGGPDPKQRRRHRKNGKRGGALVKSRQRGLRPAVPKLILANVQRLYNKIDELNFRIRTQRDFSDCCAFILTETWLIDSHPNSAMEPPGFTIFRKDRSKDITGKKQGAEFVS